MITHQPLRGLEIQEFDFEYSVPPNSQDIVVAFTARYSDEFQARGALVSYEIIDTNGNVSLPAGNYEQSPRAGTYFYMNIQETTERFMQPTVETISLPPGAEKIIFKGRQWRSRMKTTLQDFWIVPLDSEGLNQDQLQAIPEFVGRKIHPNFKKPWHRRFSARAPREPGNSPFRAEWSISKEITAPPRGLTRVRDAYHGPIPKPAHKVKVALICDEFTYNSFSPEFESVSLEPDTWQAQIEAFEPELLICESAWSGVNSKTRPWRSQIYGSLRFPKENRTKLFEILNYCKASAIPTVFWNKEDPTHFHDRVNDFVYTAARFDYVLTTAAEVVEDYRRFMPEDRVGVLQFAAQPRDFNPLPKADRKQSAVFAGAWYQVHPKRSETMHKGFRYARDSGFDLAIYDRNFGSNAESTKFPDEYTEYLRPSVPHRGTAALYRQHLVGLNFNTVTESETMFARRVFELTAAGALVVTNHSPGIEKIYGDNVVFFDRSAEKLSNFDQHEITQMRLNALQTTLSQHTYRHRFEEILRFVGIPFTSSRPNPTMMVTISSVAEAERALAQFQHRSNAFSKLLLVVDETVQTSNVGHFMTNFSSPMVSVVSLALIRQERVPVSNFLSTPDVIWVDIANPPERHQVEALMLHGEYTHLPTKMTDAKALGWGANVPEPGMRIASPDVIGALLDRDSFLPTVEVPR